MINFDIYQTVFFDCDGVVLNSNQTKTDAFRRTLKDYPSNLVDIFIDFHQMNMGISRYGKFHHFFNTIFSIENNHEIIKKSVKDFSLITREKLLDCKIIPGVEDLLSYLLDKKIQCFLVTGGDEEEVKFIFRKRKLEKYFKGIYGSPTDKYRNLEKIQEDHQIDNALFFGDSRIDLDVAEMFNLDFIFISGASEWIDGKKYCENNNYLQFKDFKEFSD